MQPAVIQRESEWAGFRNPFRLLKAEDFRDPIVFSDLFEVPERYDLVRGSDNLILEGGRGCGKSMILKSLQVSVALEIERRRRELDKAPPLVDTELESFGVYIKLARGCFDDARPDGVVSEPAAQQFFQHYFNMELLKATAEVLMKNRDAGLVAVPVREEREVCEEISDLVQPGSVIATLSELRQLAKAEQRKIRDHLAFRRIGSGNSYDGALTYVDVFPKDFCSVLTDRIEDLRERRVYFLLDEFENLAEFQQTVVNTIVKLRPQSLTMKVATRARGVKSEVDLNGEPIQIPRDYSVLPLDYDPDSAQYATLLSRICERRLRSESYAETNVRALLPSGERFQELGGINEVEKQVAEIYTERGWRWTEVAEEKRRDAIEKTATALVFRNRQSAARPRHYSGFSTFATLSSGIVSSFLELCKTSLYLAEADGINVPSGTAVPPDTQNEAVYIASRTHLDLIPRNIPRTGAAINRLVRNLADVFREKLLSHNSEPEAARVVITDPARLNAPEYEDVGRVLEDAVRWSIFHEEASAAYLARHRSVQRPEEFVFNRLLIPVLKISHRYRWRTLFTADELAGLIDDRLVDDTKRKLVEKHSGRGLPTGPGLFDEVEEVRPPDSSS